MKAEKLNPSVTMGTILAGAIALSFQYYITINVVVFLGFMLALLFFSDAKKKSILALLLPAIFAALGLFFMGLYYARGNSVTTEEMESVSNLPYAVRAAASANFRTALQLATRLLAFAGMGIFFGLTTDGERLVFSLMHQCHLSPKFAYGTLAAVNLIPNMVKEYGQVRTAFEMRGLHVGPLSTKVMFTMLVNSIRWSESVAMAMESKGFCSDEPRTYHYMMRVKWYDILFAVVVLGGIIVGTIVLTNIPGSL